MFKTVEEGHMHARLFCEILDAEGICYLYHFRHSVVNSCEDSQKIYKRMADLVRSPIITCRHVLVKERKNPEKVYLLIVDSSKGNVDFQSLRTLLCTRKLEFLNEEELEILLGTYSGNISVFQAVFDYQSKIQIVLDASLDSFSVLAFHPMYNGDTIFLPFSSVICYLEKIHHPYTLLDIPMKKRLMK